MGNPSNNQLQQELSSLQTNYLKKLPRDVRQMLNLWQKLLYVDWHEEAFNILYKINHTLASNAGTLGYPKISEVAHALELEFIPLSKTLCPPNAEQKERINLLLGNLKKLVLNEKPETELKSKVDDSREKLRVKAHQKELVFIIDPDPELSQYLAIFLQRFGYKTKVFSEFEDMFAMLGAVPNVIISEVVFPQGSLYGIEQMKNIKSELPENITILFMSFRGDLTARLQAIEAGGEVYFNKPVNVYDIVEKLDDIVAQKKESIFRVLIVEDDKTQSSYYAVLLKHAGMITEQVNKPKQLLEVLHDFQPDTILMDMHMPDYSGILLADMIHQMPEYLTIPVVFLSSEEDPELKLEAMVKGGDIFLSKPITPKHLVMALKSRVHRGRRLSNRMRYLSQKDQVTGLYNRRAFLVELNHKITQIKITHQTMLLFYIKIANFDEIKKTVGDWGMELLLSEISQKLCQYLIKEPLLGKVNETSFALLVNQDDVEDIVEYSEKIKKLIEKGIYQIKQASVTVSCHIGIVNILDEKREATEMLALASDACEQSHSNLHKIYLLETDALEKHESGLSETQIVQLVRTALDKNQFRLNYQPIANLQDDHLEKYEVLIRMLGRNKQQISPSKFMPVAERYGLTVRIDRWVIYNAINVCSLMQKNGREVEFFVKITHASLADQTLMPWVKKQFKTFHVEPKRLVFEISEATAASYLLFSQSFSQEIKDIGCGVALEHFGSTQQSFQIAEHLQLDYIKLSGKYTQDLKEKSDNQEKIREYAKLANARGIEVIAELVESADSLYVLWQCGIQYIQGNFLQAPDDSLSFEFNFQPDGGNGEVGQSED